MFIGRIGKLGGSVAMNSSHPFLVFELEKKKEIIICFKIICFIYLRFVGQKYLHNMNYTKFRLKIINR